MAREVTSANAPSAPMVAAGWRCNPWPFVLTLSFFSAFPNAASLNVGAIFYKSLGYSNAFIGYAGLLYVPFAAAFLWAPWLDRLGTKRRWHLALTLVLAGAFALLAGVVDLRPASAWPTLAAITLIAIVGATAETSMNGFFQHALDTPQQAALSGFRVAAIRVGGIIVSGVLVKICADYGARRGDAITGWVALFGVLAAVFLLSFLYHSWAMPRPPTDRAAQRRQETGVYRQVIAEVGRLPRLGVIVPFYLLYRFGEGLLTRMVAPFLLDGRAAGGLGFSVGDVAFMQGTVGAVCSILGGILGGWVIKKFGLRRVALPFALIMMLPHMLYVWLAHAVLTAGAGVDLHLATQVCIAVETFGYGLGFSVMFILTVELARGEFRSSLFALFSGLWSVGWLVPTFFSGLIQTHTGYFWLFVLSIVTAVPGVALVWYLPLAALEKGNET